MNIVHITSAHPRHDIRIFIKECVSLADSGHQVSLIVADGKGMEVSHNIQIHDVGANQGCRLLRMSKTALNVAKKARSLQPDIVHFHDPELIPFAIWLKLKGIKVIYDVHEDVPRQILAKYWIPRLVRKLVSSSFELLENYALRYFDAIITSTPHIRQRFSKRHNQVIDVCNYPILRELLQETPWHERCDEVCYLGGISRIRGIEPIIKSLPISKVRLNLAGVWDENTLRDEMMQQDGWHYVNDLGMLDRFGVTKVLKQSKIGLVTLFPTPNYLESLPIKLFEYMAAGIPVIASDFPLWRQIIQQADCGLLVDPKNPSAIANAMNELLNDNPRAQKMGSNGQASVKKNYSWEAEVLKLLTVYENIKKNHKHIANRNNNPMLR